jgi:hypothetical protein
MVTLRVRLTMLSRTFFTLYLLRLPLHAAEAAASHRILSLFEFKVKARSAQRSDRHWALRKKLRQSKQHTVPYPAARLYTHIQPHLSALRSQTICPESIDLIVLR